MNRETKKSSNLIIHTGGGVSYYHFRETVAERVRRGQNDYLYFMPVNRAVRRLKRQLVDEAPGKALVDPPVFTLDDFLLRLYSRLPRPRKVLQNEVVLFFIEDILHKDSAAFAYLLPDKRVTAGLVKKAADMVAEFRRFGYDSEKMDLKTQEAPAAEQQKYNDFLRLITRLEERFGEEYIDEPFARHRAALLFNEKSFAALYPRVREIFINGYGQFTPAMYLFIEKTALWMPVHLKLEHSVENPTLFQQTAQAAARFKEMGAVFEQDEEDSPLARYLFNRDRKPTCPVRPRGQISAHGLTNRSEEVEFIVQRIWQIQRTQSLPLQQIAVTFPNLEQYIPLLRRLFKEYKIPYNLSTGLRLSLSPLIQTFLHCLHVVESRFEYRKTLELLQSPFLQLQGKVNLYAFQRKLLERRMQYLLPGWDERLLAALPQDKRADWEKPLRLIMEKLQPLYETPSSFTADAFRRFFVALLGRLGLLEWYALENTRLTDRQRENEFRAFNRFMKQFERFIWALRHTDPRAQYSPGEIIAKLTASLGRIDYNLSEWPDYGVQVMPRLEIQAMEYRVLFLGGLVDGEFPRASGHDVFFNDKTRRQLGLLASEELLHQDRFIFYSLLDSDAQQINLTFPRYEDDRALVPSSFVAEVQDVFGIEVSIEPSDNRHFSPLGRRWQMLGLAIQKEPFDKARQTAAAIMDENPVVKESILSILRRIVNAHRRVTGERYAQYEGDLSADSKASNIIGRSFGQRVWSVSMLEEYAFCPMQFFLHRVLGLEELPQMEEGLSALERGSALHEILFRFYDFLRTQKAEDRPAEFSGELIRIASQVFDKLPLKGFFKRLEFMHLVGGKEQPGILLQLIEEDQQIIAKSGYHPAYLEWSFGYSGGRLRDPASLKDAVRLRHEKGNLRLNGSIDRVDVNADGRALIIDYKTGAGAGKEKIDTILNGLHYQLPLYALALQEHFKKSRVVWAGYYVLADAQKIKRHPLVADEEMYGLPIKPKNASLPNSLVVNEEKEKLTFQQVLDHTLGRALDITAAVKSGSFGLSRYPEENGCKSYCEYKRMCQKNVAKMKRVAENNKVDKNPDNK